MAGKHCYVHNAITSREMDGEKGHVHAVDAGSRWQPHKRDKPGHKGLLKPAGGATNITFGDCMPDEEAHALVKKRPGSERKMREMSGNHIFLGPYPVKEDCGGGGSDITGRCPPRPFSSSKANELKGHNIFEAFSNPYYPPPPPPLCPYEPQEIPLPPNKLHRNAGKLSSHFMLGGPVCVEPRRPSSKSQWAKQKMLYGSMDMDKDSYPKPVVSDMKARELAGHMNLFGSQPFHSPPSTPTQDRCEVTYCGVKDNPADSARQVHKTKMLALHGHDAVFINNDPSTMTHQGQGLKRQPLSHAKAQELRGNDIFASITPSHDHCWQSLRGRSSTLSECRK